VSKSKKSEATPEEFPEEEKLNPQERKRNANAHWPKPPKPEPTLEEFGALTVKDTKDHGELASVVRCLEVIVGEDDSHPGEYVAFSRYTWQTMMGGIRIFIPHGTTREDMAESLKEARRRLITWWGPMLDNPRMMSRLMYDVQVKNWKNEKKRKPKKVADDKPHTWPAARYQKAEKAAQLVGAVYLAGRPRSEREEVLNRWLVNNPDLCRDAIAVTFLTNAELTKLAGKAKSKASRKSPG
jgi:hypothetical protein